MSAEQKLFGHREMHPIDFESAIVMEENRFRVSDSGGRRLALGRRLRQREL